MPDDFEGEGGGGDGDAVPPYLPLSDSRRVGVGPRRLVQAVNYRNHDVRPLPQPAGGHHNGGSELQLPVALYMVWGGREVGALGAVPARQGDCPVQKHGSEHGGRGLKTGGSHPLCVCERVMLLSEVLAD
eukprot:CAMPEP_0169456520 /NCGR_PEP_ID=MMETSP1042-20121227/16397_1 /TAXON_ID=464988 /ORGANISM="Hemiselmis andersenii, Strain CCMP1180" /LENGTH=129 /DNA_ID=CAMNT_0009568749 /DNA_START=277 /DNA_END=667 /DNA_ORIENTATION=-